MTSQQQIDPRLTQIDNALYRISAKALVIEDSKVLLVREKDDDWWSFPGGGVDYGETIHEALVREVGEELGIAPEHVNVDDTVLFIAIGAVVDGVPKANLFYRVAVPTEEIKPTEDVLEQKWYGLAELPRLYISPSTGNVVNELHKILREAK